MKPLKQCCNCKERETHGGLTYQEAFICSKCMIEIATDMCLPTIEEEGLNFNSLTKLIFLEEIRRTFKTNE